ncbi:MAG TPA: hypothetical protein VK766_03870 [Cytophagaceae bacterium]|jgi:hypothetical protein|nr:hypothetical protein [Cytophagaceae bacterium]
MKKNFFLVGVIISLIVFEANAQGGGILKKHSPEIQKIIKTDVTGVVRGFDFGTPADKIKATEDAKLEAETLNALIYRIPISAKEYCEVIYYLDASKKIRSFGLEFFETKDATPEETLIDDFQAYFSERYGAFKVNDKDDEVWTAKDGSYSIELSDETNGDIVEIEIEIARK